MGVSFWLVLPLGGAVHALARSGRRMIAAGLGLTGAAAAGLLALGAEAAAPLAFVQGAAARPDDVAAWLTALADDLAGAER